MMRIFTADMAQQRAIHVRHCQGKMYDYSRPPITAMVTSETVTPYCKKKSKAHARTPRRTLYHIDIQDRIINSTPVALVSPRLQFFCNRLQ
ncbi:hypothetical protein OWV82_013439 [Melia azedarach]|uniref:Uncharacterized protein n=1 Tax=Melia azedarach TaxID=155640 RepID=A0ACC1XUC0_MELAZ|nr:hypothetical protein OWV82_013439 [Melia azedarach]